MGKVRDVLRLFVPSVTAFFLGGAVMTLGLVVSRLVAAALGTSLYTWTSIVGILSAGLSVGGFLGGRIADRYDARRVLAVLFGLASAACVAVIMLHHLLASHGAWLWKLSWPGHVFLHVCVMLFVPALLLGTIAPVLAKVTLSPGAGLGRAAGVLCAAGAAGSAAGMLLTGFYLIPSYGSIAIVWMLGAALLGMALFYWTSCWSLYLWAMIFAALMTMGMAPAQWAREGGVGAFLREANDPNVIYEDDTAYGHIAIRQMSDRPNRRSFRRDTMRPAEIVIDEVTRLSGFHSAVYAGVTYGLAEGRTPMSMMVIGGRSYAFPRYLKSSWPESLVQVIEIDPGVTEAARRAGGLGGDAGIETVDADARYYTDRLLIEQKRTGNRRPFDFIYCDMIDDGSVSFHLLTREFNEKLARLLAGDGAYLLNLLDTCEGSQFLGAVLGTLEATFAHVDVVAEPVGPVSARSSFVVVASHRAFDTRRFLEDYDERLKFRLLDRAEVVRLKERSDYRLLTDDYAPVETLLASTSRQGAEERLARRYLWEAERLRAQQQYEPSAQRYKQASELDPALAIEAWNGVGVMRLTRGDLPGAAEAFRRVIGHEDGAGSQTMAVASAHMNLGIVLIRTGRRADARTPLTEAAKWFRVDLARNPDSVVSWDWLGDTLALAGDLKGASEAFDRAMALEPKNLAYYEKLAKVLEEQHRYDEAIAVAKKHIALLKEMGQRDVAVQMGPYVDYLEYQKIKQRK